MGLGWPDFFLTLAAILSRYMCCLLAGSDTVLFLRRRFLNRFFLELTKERRYSRFRLVWVLSEGTGFSVMSRYVPKLEAP